MLEFTSFTDVTQSAVGILRMKALPNSEPCTFAADGRTTPWGAKTSGGSMLFNLAPKDASTAFRHAQPHEAQ
jgi:hypothetical protein